jgi:hypothetical protein
MSSSAIIGAVTVIATLSCRTTNRLVILKLYRSAVFGYSYHRLLGAMRIGGMKGLFIQLNGMLTVIGACARPFR